MEQYEGLEKFEVACLTNKGMARATVFATSKERAFESLYKGVRELGLEVIKPETKDPEAIRRALERFLSGGNP